MSNVNPIPEGLHTITPHITVRGAARQLIFIKAPSAPRNYTALRLPMAA